MFSCFGLESTWPLTPTLAHSCVLSSPPHSPNLDFMVRCEVFMVRCEVSPTGGGYVVFPDSNRCHNNIVKLIFVGDPVDDVYTCACGWCTRCLVATSSLWRKARTSPNLITFVYSSRYVVSTLRSFVTSSKVLHLNVQLSRSTTAIVELGCASTHAVPQRLRRVSHECFHFPTHVQNFHFGCPASLRRLDRNNVRQNVGNTQRTSRVRFPITRFVH